MGKSSGGGGTNTVVQNSQPPAAVMQQYQNVIGQANSAASAPYTTGGFNANNMVAGFNPMQTSAYNTINNAQGIQTPYFNQAQTYLNNSQTPIWNNVQQYSPNTMANYANPYMNQAVGATMANINESNAEQQQQVMGNAISSGAWGGDRSAIAQTELARQQALAENQTISGMENTGFNQQQGEFNTQQQAQIGANEANAWLGTQGSAIESNLGTTAQNAAFTGANQQEAAGAQQQQLAQEQMNVPYEQFQAAQAYPFQNLGWLSNISTGVGGSMGGTGTTTSPGPSTLGQIGAVGLGGVSLLGESGAFPSTTGGVSSSGWLSGLMPGSARGGAVPHRARGGFLPRHYDVGGGTGGNVPGFLPISTFENSNVPDASASYIPGGVNPKGNMGPPSVSNMKPTGSTSTTTGGPNNSNGLSPANFAGLGKAAKGIGQMINGAPAAGAGFDASGGMTAIPATLPSTSGVAGAFGSDLASTAAPMAAAPLETALPSALPSLDAGATMMSAMPETLPALDAAAPATDALASTGFFSGIGDALAAAGSATMDFLPALFAAKRGGAIPARARGGFLPHYDDGGGVGGLTPSVTGSNPFIQNQYAQYNNMSAEQLQQLAARSPQNPVIRAALQKKQMTGGGQPQPQQQPVAQGMQPTAQPQGIMAQQGYARGGMPRHYDAGGSDDGPPFTNDAPPMSTENATKMVNLYGDDDKNINMSVPSAAAPNAPSGLTPATNIPDHDTFMKNYANSVTNAEPYNKTDPWLALGATAAGMLASRSPYAGVALGEGMQEGLKNYGEQKKEAAQESEKRGTLQEQGEALYNQVINHKDEMSKAAAQLQEEHERNTATAGYQQGELGSRAAELKEKTANDLAERQKPIPDGFGGFLIPNPQDPTHSTTIYPGASPGTGGGDSSGSPQVSMANAWKPPLDKDGKPITGDDYYKTLPPVVGKVAQEMVNGDKASPSAFGSRDPVLRAGEAAATNGDPTYRGTRYATIQDFTLSSRPANQTMRAQNAVMEHMPVLQDAVTALDNGDVRAFNSLANQVAKQAGLPAPTNMELAKTVVADEMAKAVLGNRVTQGDRRDFAANLETSAGRKQLQGQLDEGGRLMAGQAHTLEQDYNTGTGLDANKTPSSVYDRLNYRDKFMLPNARKLMEKYYPTPLPAAADRVVGKTYWGPGGKQMTWAKDEKGYGWAAPQGAQ